MKKLLIVLLLSFVIPLKAILHNAEIVVDKIKIVNNSLFPIEINGRKYKDGNTYYVLDPHQDPIENHYIAIKLHNGKEHCIKIPIFDISWEEAFKDGKTPTEICFEYDVIISPKWIFGQKIKIGENFNNITVNYPGSVVRRLD
ncbi:hypothetical protein M1446_00990 [Candidatus Dependentiae bacterium]|nr:hypothetical protein [Candidatus Dependentiae bacterium]